MNGSLYTDAPLKNPEDDRLGFRLFAEKVADTIRKLETKESVVFALYGKWGSGKTTFLNFLVYYLEKDKSITIVKFNPWWFSGRDDLLLQFLYTMEYDLSTSKKFKKIVKVLEPYRKAFEKIISTLGVTYGSVFIHRLGYEHGFELATHIKSSIQMKEIREYLTLLTSILKSIGLVYDMEVVKIEKDNYTFKLIKPINSVYVRGILTGFISNIIGKQYSSFEIKLSDNEYIVTIAPY